jgi:hypothetical protein
VAECENAGLKGNLSEDYPVYFSGFLKISIFMKASHSFYLPSPFKEGIHQIAPILPRARIDL